MNDQLKLSDAEWAMIVDLLQREQRDLPVEIHHSRASTTKQDLHVRLEMIRGLLERLQATAPAA